MAPVVWAEAALTPAQTAYLRQEIRRAQEQFIRDVAKVVDTKEIVVRSALPDRARITDPVSRMMTVLEQNLGRQLTDEQKAAIRETEDAYQTTIRNAAKEARKQR